LPSDATLKKRRMSPPPPVLPMLSLAFSRLADMRMTVEPGPSHRPLTDPESDDTTLVIHPGVKLKYAQWN